MDHALAKRKAGIAKVQRLRKNTNALSRAGSASSLDDCLSQSGANPPLARERVGYSGLCATSTLHYRSLILSASHLLCYYSGGRVRANCVRIVHIITYAGLKSGSTALRD
eukprot:5277934-Pyramimonas_sp.AAC.1